MAEQVAQNIVWHQSMITRNDRESLLQQQGKVLWFTGMSGSGKSTIANELAVSLHKLGKLTYLLDGDNVRYGINRDLGFSTQDRKENIRRVGEICKLFADAGIIVLASFITPFEEDRKSLRELLAQDYVEVYVDCPLAECEKRDPKDLYKKARAGEIKEFTGISAPYEIPQNPEIIIHSSLMSPSECANELLQYLGY